MGGNSSLLLSADFRVASGGISRVAHLMDEAMHFDYVLSFYGHNNKEGKASRISYFSGNSLMYTTKVLTKIFCSKFNLIAIDHLGIASVLLFVPRVFLNKVVIFLHDEEAWVTVVGRKRIALKKASLILTNSSYTYNLFIENNPEFEEKTKVCLLGGVPEGFKKEVESEPIKFKEWFKNKNPYLIFVSRLWKEHRYKGYWELLQAFKTLNCSEDFKLRLAIVGSGNDADTIENFINEHNLENRVRLFKNISDQELAYFYQKSLGLIFPSIREGFGFVFIEAMYFGKGAIGVTNQPADEIIIDGKTGVLLKDNSVESIAQVLNQVNEDSETFLRMGAHAYEHYLKNFTNNNFTSRFLKIINEGSVYNSIL